ncbi:ZPR1 zinc-finger domain-containing protein [Lentinula raphanica]|uniref:ZPR1 zinc-finger domain-containing protein n=1 Tax=Lentinula raphanica TaxID=153919 RepID=A0AA38PEG9_9AGAR|nr:ZPR1 zinc-finger domain-containing protein [Lentinula raphanica]KAJ3976093.1 ZPR1 zinc-finger domain-containing protein [Lentinula raphanica]
MSQDNKEDLFPAIGVIADKADQLPEENIPDASADNAEEKPMQEVESLCMKCGEQGITRMLLTSIPYFREIIVMSFRCEHCGASNNEIQSAGAIRPEGTLYTARILARSDLDRQIVRSASASIVIPELQLTLPSSARGQLTTVEGLIRDIVADLSMDQPLRRIQDEDSYTKIQSLIDKLKDILGDDEDEEGDEENAQASTKASEKDTPMPAFTVKLDDPSGNSWIEFIGSISDPKWNMRTYPRTLQQNIELGLVAAPDESASAVQGVAKVSLDASESDVVGGEVEGSNEEIYVFPGSCSSCGHPLDTMMKKVNIPYFKDIIIMSTNCDRCGYRDNEVKSGAAISEKGKKLTLKVEDREDLSRDILKSETAGLTIPEIDLVLTHGTLGGRFTTLEGILDQVYEELSEKIFSGDSASNTPEATKERSRFEKFLGDLKDIKSAARPFTLIIDDPLANSYIQNLYAPDPDPAMTVELYERTWQQNEDLGLNDMKVEGYEADTNTHVDVTDKENEDHAADHEEKVVGNESIAH